MKIIFGLGNPGFWYRGTRHNIGSDVVRRFAKEHQWKLRGRGYGSRYVSGRFQKTDVMLVIPTTYMNNSGEAVDAVIKTFQVEQSNILVVVDDFQIPLGTLRFRKKGSSGGHNGLQSICGKVGENFCRLRLGIGPKPDNCDIVKYVLGGWKRKQKPVVKRMKEKAVEALETFIIKGIESAESRHNAPI